MTVTCAVYKTSCGLLFESPAQQRVQQLGLTEKHFAPLPIPRLKYKPVPPPQALSIRPKDEEETGPCRIWHIHWRPGEQPFPPSPKFDVHGGIFKQILQL